MRAGALKYRPTPGIPSDQLCKSQERPACSLKCISALQGWGRCPCHTARPFPLCPGPKAARIPQARGSRCCWGYTDRRGGLISPRVCAGAGARRVRQPGRSLSYCSLCCTHPVEKSQMSAWKAGIRDGSFERGLQVAQAWGRDEVADDEEAETTSTLRRWRGADLCVSGTANLFVPAGLSPALPERCRGIKPLLDTILSLWDMDLDHDLILGDGWVSGSAPEKGPGSSLGRAAAKSCVRNAHSNTPQQRGETPHPESHIRAMPHINNREPKEKKQKAERKGEKWLMVMKSINHVVINSLTVVENVFL